MSDADAGDVGINRAGGVCIFCSSCVCIRVSLSTRPPTPPATIASVDSASIFSSFRKLISSTPETETSTALIGACGLLATSLSVASGAAAAAVTASLRETTDGEPLFKECRRMSIFSPNCSTFASSVRCASLLETWTCKLSTSDRSTLRVYMTISSPGSSSPTADIYCDSFRLA